MPMQFACTAPNGMEWNDEWEKQKTADKNRALCRLIETHLRRHVRRHKTKVFNAFPCNGAFAAHGPTVDTKREEEKACRTAVKIKQAIKPVICKYHINLTLTQDIANHLAKANKRLRAHDYTFRLNHAKHMTHILTCNHILSCYLIKNTSQATNKLTKMLLTVQSQNGEHGNI